MGLQTDPHGGTTAILFLGEEETLQDPCTAKELCSLAAGSNQGAAQKP
jgi:hypothetical protein